MAGGGGSGRRLPAVTGAPPASGSPPAAGTPPRADAAPAGRHRNGRHRNGRRGNGRLPEVAVAVVPAVAGLITGGYHIGVPPLWRDEAATKAIAGRPAFGILATLPHDDVVHGAYYLVVHVVIRLFGDSNAALRLPSLLAMAVACAFTALIARRLAAPAGRWHAAATGLTAGLLLAVLPAMIRYAQEARSYAIVTMLAAIASYLLLGAVDHGGWRRWAGYGLTAFLAGLFNAFGLLIVVAHGITLLVTGARRAAERRVLGVPLAWLAAVAAATAALVPLLLLAYAERNAISWMSPGVRLRESVIALAHLWTGPRPLTWTIFGLAALGVVASLIAGRRALSPATVALPWLVTPPAVLLAASEVHPVYDVRYVEFCLPALAITAAAGIGWLWRGAAAAVTHDSRPAWRGAVAAALAVASAVALVIALQPADATVRSPGYRPDNLEYEARIIATNYRPGDIVFFIPINDRIDSLPFPGPWRKLRDIALAKTPAAANDLYGTDVSPAELRKRFAHVTRAWLVSSADVPIAKYLASARATPLDREEFRLLGSMRRLHRWRDNDTDLTLYATRKPSPPPSPGH